MRFLTSSFSVLLKIVPLRSDSAASVCDSAAWIMKPQETHFQSEGKSFPAPCFPHADACVAAVTPKSLGLSPVSGPMRGSSTPQRQPINRRQFSVQMRGLSERLMSPLHVHFTSFCSIGLIWFFPPALLCYLPCLCSPSTLSASVLLLSRRALANLCACVRDYVFEKQLERRRRLFR